MNRLIVTLLVCPIRWIRITACSSTAGFHHGSYNRCKILVHQNYIPRLLNRNMLSMEIEWQKVKKKDTGVFLGPSINIPLRTYMHSFLKQYILFSTWEDNIPNKFSTKFLEMKWVLFLNPHPPQQQKKLELVKAKLTPSMISNTDTLHFKKITDTLS